MSFSWSLSKNGEPIDSATFTVSEDSTLFQIVTPAAAINGANFSSLNEALEAAKSVENAALTLKDDVSCSDIDLTMLRTFDLNGHMLTISDGAFRFALTELSNFDIKLNPTATFTAENGTVDGEHASITLYAKYGAAGLYTDRARTTAAALVPQSATGYTLSAIKGNGSGALCPASPVLRGEAAQILMNLGA